MNPALRWLISLLFLFKVNYLHCALSSGFTNLFNASVYSTLLYLCIHHAYILRLQKAWHQYNNLLLSHTFLFHLSFFSKPMAIIQTIKTTIMFNIIPLNNADTLFTTV